MTTPDPFAPGYRLTDGNQLNDRIANPVWSTTSSISATPGGTMLNSVAITDTITNITTAIVAGAGVTLPQALLGTVLVVSNNSANDVRIFAEGNSTIDGLDGQIGIILEKGLTAIFTAVATKQWTWLNTSANAGITSVQTINALRHKSVDTFGVVLVEGYYVAGDGGGGNFYGVEGAAPGYYIDNGGTIIVPTGGDGSSAWLRTPFESMTLAQFGAKGDGTTDDTARFQAALNAAGNNMTVYLQGTVGSIFYCASSFTVSIGVTLAGLGWLNESGFNPVTRIGPALAPFESTILLGSGATITCDQLSTVRDLHVLPYGMTFPQSNSIGWSGTAIIVRPSVTLERLQIVGFDQAVYMYSGARVFCSRILFDCNNGIHVENSVDPTYLEYCEGWPFASAGYTGPIDTLAQQTALWGRSGVAFAYANQNDAGLSSYCFAFAYAVGHRITNISGMRFYGCGSDGPADPDAGYVGVILEGSTDTTVFTNCAFVAQSCNMELNLAAGSRTIFLSGCILGSSSNDNIQILQGTLHIHNTTFGGSAAGTAVNMFGATSGLTITGCYFNNYPTTLIYNHNASPYVWISPDNDTAGLTVPLYDPGQVFYDITAQSNINLPIQGNFFRIIGATAITSFTGGWPGRTVTFVFVGGNTVQSSATLRLNSTFSTTSSDILTLICDGQVWYEVSRSINV